METEKLTFGGIVNRLTMLLFCGLAVLGMYAAVMLPVVLFDYGAVMRTAEEAETSGFDVGMAILAVISVLYVIPLYFFYFKRDNDYKRLLLHIPEDGSDPKKVVCTFLRVAGKWDLLIYCVFSLLMLLLSLGSSSGNPAVFVCVQQAFFYDLPLPRVVSYLLAVVCVAVQYTVCLLLAARSWRKNALYRGEPGEK